MTISAHGYYTWAGNAMARKHQAEVQAKYPDLSEPCQAYLACNMELDLALECLVDKLEAAGIADDTLIVMTGDHYPYLMVEEGGANLSGGEKKRLETLQMSILKPALSILDEADSGLDIDALKVVAEGVNGLRDGQRSMLVITHYQRLLNYVVPDFVHVYADGRIVKSGTKELALELEEKGYAEFVREK